MATSNLPVPVERIQQRIFVIRDQRVMLDADLAKLFGVSTKRLNQQVRRNAHRFPPDFMFSLTRAEFDPLKLQIATSKGRGGRRKLPLAFTEHGAIMAANVLNSHRAIEASVYVVRAFVKLRETLASHKVLAGKLTELERRLDTHDVAIQDILAAIRRLMTPPPTRRREAIGFRPTMRPARASSGLPPPTSVRAPRPTSPTSSRKAPATSSPPKCGPAPRPSSPNT